MISTYSPYCRDVQSIENYADAVNDQSCIWHLHHRFGIAFSDRTYSAQDLQDMGLYYMRPSDELIFLTPFWHMRVHSLRKKNLIPTIPELSDAEYKEFTEMFKKFWYPLSGESSKQRFERELLIYRFHRKTPWWASYK